MEDHQIVQLYWDRDEAAIPATEAKYGAYCRTIAGNILSDRRDAEECVNETWLNTWNAIPPHRPRILATFLGKITRNLSFNRYKHNRAAKRGGGQTEAILDELAECVSGAPGAESPEHALDARELAAEIDAKVREQLFANKDASEADKAAIAVQQQEEEDDLALLEEELDEEI